MRRASSERGTIFIPCRGDRGTWRRTRERAVDILSLLQQFLRKRGQTFSFDELIARGDDGSIDGEGFGRGASRGR